MRLFARDTEGDLRQIESRPLESEAALQELLARHHNLLPLPLDPRREVMREFPTDAGPIDHVVVDAGGTILVLETKLARNTTRRQVTAQAIDYAAQLTKYGPQSFLQKARAIAGEDFTADWFESRGERNRFLLELETNLQQGRLTILIVMDQADELLKDAVRFLNRATHFSVLLAEVQVSDLRGQEIVSVDVYGTEMVEEKSESTRSDRARSPMDRDSFIEEAARNGLGQEALAFLDALDWVAEEDEVTTEPLTSGFYLACSPFVPNNYLAWQAGRETVDVWSTQDVYDEMTAHLRASPAPWEERVTVRIPDSPYGKIAKFAVRGATKHQFQTLFEHYLAGPGPESMRA